MFSPLEHIYITNNLHVLTWVDAISVWRWDRSDNGEAFNNNIAVQCSKNYHKILKLEQHFRDLIMHLEGIYNLNKLPAINRMNIP